MKEMNNIPFPKDKMNKVDYMWRDIERRAEGYGFFAKTPVPYPLSEFDLANQIAILGFENCLLYTSPSPRDGLLSRMPSSA